VIRPIDSTCVAVPEVAAHAAGDEPRAASAVDSAGRAEPGSFREALLGLRESEREVDALLERTLARGVADPQELLRLQVVVHRFQYQIELAARLVDQVSQGVRTLTRPT
jgi:hypothetical protein